MCVWRAEEITRQDLSERVSGFTVLWTVDTDLPRQLCGDARTAARKTSQRATIIVRP